MVHYADYLTSRDSRIFFIFTPLSVLAFFFRFFSLSSQVSLPLLSLDLSLSLSLSLFSLSLILILSLQFVNLCVWFYCVRS